jgi:hypothetical protein
VLIALVAFLCLGVGLALAAAGGGHAPGTSTGDATSSGEAVSQDQPASEPPDTGDQNENDGTASEQPPAQPGDCDATTAATHGAYVSCVAQTAPKGPEHGKAVSAAAHTKRDDKRAARSSGDESDGEAGPGHSGSHGHGAHGGSDDPGKGGDS